MNAAEKFRRLTNPATVEDYGLSMVLDELREAAKSDPGAARLVRSLDDLRAFDEASACGDRVRGMARNARKTCDRISYLLLAAAGPSVH